MNKNIYIQKGVKKIYNNDRDNVLYVTQFPMDVKDRNGYCIDSRGANSFFYVIDDNSGYRLIECNKDRDINKYISYDELDRGYIRLDEFIKDGKFIGREFRRISSVITYYGVDKDNARIIDNRYLDIDCYNNKYIVLYENDNTFLVKYMYGTKGWYGIIDCRYTQDKMYEFIGDTYVEYMNRDKVYLEILEQIDSHSNKYIKIKHK